MCSLRAAAAGLNARLAVGFGKAAATAPVGF
jgi:hypothetical protein